MTREEAVDFLKAGYPDSCYEELREAFDTAVEALEQIRSIEGIIDVSNITIQEDALKYKMIVDIVRGGGEPKRGKWKWTDGTYTCSKCSYHASEKAWEILNGVLQLCPNCGARMETDGIDIE